MKRVVLFGLLLTLGGGVRAAGVIDIAWDARGRFAHDQQVEPGQFAEICGPLQKGDAIAWQYQGNAALDFNIHYHVGETVIYPLRKPSAKAARGQNYCWMWTNKGQQPVALKAALRRKT
jgi:hypothetical protein